MISRARRLRYRRQLRMHKLQLHDLGSGADKYFFRRLDHIPEVRRFAIGWILLLVALVVCSVAQIYSLSGYYQKLKPARGGIYTEGVVGAFTNANPVYASSVADNTVSELVFSSLLNYDDRNNLVGDLAESWTADDRGQIYTIKLRPNIVWHDGKPLTAEDVAFTYSVIQNPDAQSPLYNSWQGVSVKVVDPRTLTFTLTNPLASFPHSLTNGIIPHHILKDVHLADMRSTSFNTVNLIGSGPFFWQDLNVSGASNETRQEKIVLGAFDKYHFGKPKLDNFVVNVFRSENLMLESFKRNELQAMVGLLSEPKNIQKELQTYKFTQTAAMMTFFKTTEGVLSEKSVRQALVRSANTKLVRKELPFPVQSVDQPLLKGQIGYDPALAQLGYDPAAAAKLLDDAGWKQAKPGDIRTKEGKRLEFTLFAESNDATAVVTRQLQQQWRKIGVDAKIELQDVSEFQITLSQHSYDALLHGISIGSDPDVFVFWHSTQADVLSSGRLNLSEYKSSVVDTALEQARTRTDPALRTAKYKTVLSAWRDDAPALGLYQPVFIYITKQPVYGLQAHEINKASDRFSNVQEWMVRRVKTTVDK